MAKDIDGHYDPDFIESYVIGGTTPELQQYMHVFLPNPDKHPKPLGGYPVFMTTGFQGFATAYPADNVPTSASGDELQHYRYLEDEGYLVISVGLTGSYETNPGVPNTTSPGRGLFHPSGTAGWSSVTKYSGPKEAVLAVQMVRERASVWGANPGKIVVEGYSAGSVAFTAPAFWPDQADPSQTDHRRHSSRVLGVKFGIWQTDFRIYDTSVAIPANFNHFPSATLGVGGVDNTTVLAASFGDVPAGYMKWSSALEIGLGTAVDRARNASGLHVWQHHFIQGTHMTDMTLTGTWGESTGKLPTQSNYVDANLSAALHEAGAGVLLATALREIELNTWHTKNSKLSYDIAAYFNVVTIHPPSASLVDSIQPFGAIIPNRTVQENDWLRGVYGTTQVIAVKQPKAFMFEPDWSSVPKVKLLKTLSTARTSAQIEQRTTQMQRFECLRTYTVQYVTANKFEARDLEHALASNLGGTFLIPFYPEIMIANVVDLQGSNISAAELPDWGYPVFGPANFDDINKVTPHPMAPGAYYLQGDWKLFRFDYADWSNFEIVDADAFLGSPVNLFIGMKSAYQNTIPVHRQSLAWADEVMLSGPPKTSHITDTQTVYTITWRSVR